MPPTEPFPPDGAGAVQALDPGTLRRLFGREGGLLPLWIAEPQVPVAEEIVEALEARAAAGWYGYETRPPRVLDAFRAWMRRRHGWELDGDAVEVSPSVGTSLAVLIDLVTDPGDGVILQPPVFTDFKPVVRNSGRTPVANPLVMEDGRYVMDLADLEEKAADPANRVMILCNPHNPVGRAWTAEELTAVAALCEAHDVVVLADELHADLTLAPHRFTPFAVAAEGRAVRWAATHGPLKTFGLAGVCDTLVVTDDDELRTGFRGASDRFHLTRNHVFGIAAFEAAYRGGDRWLDDLLDLVAANVARLEAGLPDGVELVTPEATYLAWLDLRALGLDVPELARWLVEEAGLALSPGHWFGRQGAGFARMTIAVGPEVIDEAVTRLARAVGA